MPTLSDLVRRHTGLEATAEEWLHLLVEDWQLLSDLAFADLVLWVPARDGDGYVAVAHCRPSTAATVYHDDMVGQRLARGSRPQVDAAMDTGRVCRARDPQWLADVPVREETVPVARDGRVVAVMARRANLAEQRTPSRLELAYLQCADALATMVSQGTYPTAGSPTGLRRGAPRVGDGMLRLDAEGVVRYASPNAVAAFHRIGVLGDLVGLSLAQVVADVLEGPGPVDETLPLVLTGRAPWRADVEVRRVVLSLRALPLQRDAERTGALLLCRDVSELRRREQELLTKDATIREIHHRVKNNLQTVAALLRLQARRVEEPSARRALGEATRRVATIAMVHQTLSQRFDEWVDFDTVADQCLALAVDVSGPEHTVRRVRHGSFGMLRAEDATPLALVLTELVTNAVGHGLAERDGCVVLEAERDGGHLVVTVVDDGAGLPEGFAAGQAGGLGLRIVRALVAGELDGTITWQDVRAAPGAGDPGSTGTSVHLSVPLRGDAPAPPVPASGVRRLAQPQGE